VTIGVGIVVLALGGGAFAMKDSLFGTMRVGADSSAVDTSAIQNLAMQDTTKPDTTTQAQNTDTLNQNGGTTNPRPGRRDPPRDSTRPTTPGNATVDVAGLERQVGRFIDDIEFTDDAAKRAEASRIGRDVYANRDLPAKLRAEAAFIVGQVLLKEAESDESKRPQAKTWVQRAVDLDPRSAWVALLQGI
jgi:hypothetical protein